MCTNKSAILLSFWSVVQLLMFYCTIWLDSLKQYDINPKLAGLLIYKNTYFDLSFWTIYIQVDILSYQVEVNSSALKIDLACKHDYRKTT